MQWWACNPQVLMLYMQFELSDFAKYRYRCMEKHDADLLQVGQNVLVRMGHQMKEKSERQNCKARSDKAKQLGIKAKQLGIMAKQLGIMAKGTQQYGITAIRGQTVKTMQQAHNHLAM